LISVAGVSCDSRGFSRIHFLLLALYALSTSRSLRRYMLSRIVRWTTHKAKLWSRCRRRVRPWRSARPRPRQRTTREAVMPPGRTCLSTGHLTFSRRRNAVRPRPGLRRRPMRRRVRRLRRRPMRGRVRRWRSAVLSKRSSVVRVRGKGSAGGR